MSDDLEITELQPLFDRLIVRPDKVEEQTAGGLILPTMARPKPDTGEVLAVGPGRLDNFGLTHPVPVGVGERILFAQHSGTELSVDDGKYLILNAGDILGVLRTPEEQAERERAELEARRSADPRES